jgi:hypothetical protein
MPYIDGSWQPSDMTMEDRDRLYRFWMSQGFSNSRTGVDVRISNALANEGVASVEELANIPRHQLMRLPNLGSISICAIDAWLHEHCPKPAAPSASPPAPPFAITLLPVGCICPPTSERTCGSPICPRRHPHWPEPPEP